MLAWGPQTLTNREPQLSQPPTQSPNVDTRRIDWNEEIMEFQAI